LDNSCLRIVDTHRNGQIAHQESRASASSLDLNAIGHGIA
jgi:hypothetical protein